MERGLKDRIDLLSPLLYSDRKPALFRDLARKFDPASELTNVLLRTVRESRAEYKYPGLRYECDGRKLRSAVEELLVRGR